MSGALFAAVVATTLGSSAPTYILSVAGNATSVDEGADLTFYVNTTNVEDGTTLYVYVGSTGTYDISSRFSNGTGTAVAIYSNVGSFTENVSADNTTAGGTQSYNIFLSTTSSPPTPVGNTVTITVNDTSQSSVWLPPTNYAPGFRIDIYNGTWDGTEAWFAGKTVIQTSTNSQAVGAIVGLGGAETQVYRGYFVATATGNVTFSVNAQDSPYITKAWFGNYARGVPSDNTAAFTITGTGSHSYTVSLNSGDYYPLYVVTGETNGGGIVIDVNGGGLSGGTVLWNDGTHAAYNTDTGGI